MKEIDRELCFFLQEKARTPLSELAEKVKLSVPSVSDHVKKLEERSVVSGYHAKLNPREFDLDICAFVFITIESSVNYNEFIDFCKKRIEIQECHATIGEASHLLKVRVKNTSSLETLLGEIQRIRGVKRTLTNLVLSTHKETTSIDTGFALPKKPLRGSPSKK